LFIGHRRQHHRHGRRRGRRARQGNGIEIRTEDVEGRLVEDKTGTGRDVGRRGQNQRTTARVQIAEGGTIEQDFVVQLGRQF
jgi:hypothetical protein